MIRKNPFHFLFGNIRGGAEIPLAIGCSIVLGVMALNSIHSALQHEKATVTSNRRLQYFYDLELESRSLLFQQYPAAIPAVGSGSNTQGMNIPIAQPPQVMQAGLFFSPTLIYSLLSLIQNGWSKGEYDPQAQVGAPTKKGENTQDPSASILANTGKVGGGSGSVTHFTAASGGQTEYCGGVDFTGGSHSGSQLCLAFQKTAVVTCNSTVDFGDPFAIRWFINSKYKSLIIQDTDPNSGTAFADKLTAQKVCDLTGDHPTLISYSDYSIYGVGTGYKSPGNNTMGRWTGKSWYVDNAASMGNDWLAEVHCGCPPACVPNLKGGVITFEEFDEGQIIDAVTNAQLLKDHGVTMKSLLGDQLQVVKIAREGESEPNIIAYLSTKSSGKPNHNRLIDSADEQRAGHRALATTDVFDSKNFAFEADYAVPVSHLSIDLLDLDGGESWTIEAFDSKNKKVNSTVLTFKTYGAASGNEAITTYSMTNKDANISRVVFTGSKSIKIFGWAFDNFDTGLIKCP